MISDGEMYLLRSDEAKHFEKLDLDEKIANLKNRIVQQSSLSRSQHIEAIAHAYAMYSMTKMDPGLELAIVKAAEQLDRIPKSKISVLRLIVELHIGYGENKTPKDKLNAGKLYSRDVMAINNLIQRKIKASEVVELSRQPHEGLDAWQRYKSSVEVQVPALQTSEKDDIGLSPEMTAIVENFKEVISKAQQNDEESDNDDVSSSIKLPLEAKTSYQSTITWERIGGNGKRVVVTERLNHVSFELIGTILNLMKNLNIPN